MKFYATVSLLILSACASTQMTAQEIEVRILRNTDAPKDCKSMGSVMVYSYDAMTTEGREDVLKKRAFALNGNTVTIDKYENEGTAIRGTSYQCPN
jgi:hypothetical protein